ncbi:MAG: DUF3866 family protein, partial [Candidatus Syntrophonatronum acetioxidans]
MFRLRPGTIKEITRCREELEEALVSVEGKEEKALNYPRLTGRLLPGDRVILNTTALHLGLGTGGRHFVFFNHRHSQVDMGDKGHIIKLRYTPYQLKVFSCEEEESPFNSCFHNYKGLENTPVLIGELHSMLIPAAAVIKYLCPHIRIGYVMTDGASLPLALSEGVNQLKKLGIIAGAVTSGHAFGGDLEAVNNYSALIAAREILKAQVIIITMGPGAVGTGTEYGFTGIEQGELINAVNILEGDPFLVLRVSFQDNRLRHRGISHHSLTVLEKIALTPATLCLPLVEEKKLNYLKSQLEERSISSRHQVAFREGTLVKEAMDYFHLKGNTMGRSFEEDRIFFETVGATARLVSEKILLEKSQG